MAKLQKLCGNYGATMEQVWSNYGATWSNYGATMEQLWRIYNGLYLFVIYYDIDKNENTGLNSFLFLMKNDYFN